MIPTQGTPSESSGAETLIDPGAPFQHDRETPDQPTQKKTDAPDPRDEEIARLRAENLEATNNAKFWSDRARRAGNAPETEEEPERPQRRRQAAADDDEDKPEQLLDDLSTKGMKALVEKGVITMDQLLEELDKRDQRLEARYSADKEGEVFDRKLEGEFPDLFKDNERISKGQAPKTEIYKRTATHFARLVDESGIKPESEAARAVMLAAARLAKSELEAEGMGEDTRRDRIERQNGRGGRAGGADTATGRPGPGELSPKQQSIVNNLRRYGASEDKFNQFAGKTGSVAHER